MSALVAGLLFKMGRHDTDYLWHYKLGEWIIQNQTIPTTDIFSWIGIEKSLPYTAHSWLYSTTFCLVGQLFGNIHILAMIFSMLSAFILYLFTKTTLFPRRNAVSLILSMLIGYLCANTRPQSVSYLLFLFMIIIFTKAMENKNVKSWILMPFVGCLWANLHGGTTPIILCIEVLFLLLMILPNFKVSFFENCTVYGYDASNLVKFEGYKDKEKFKNYLQSSNLYRKHIFKNCWKYVVMIIATVVGICFNPYTIKLLTWGFTENSSITKQYISEWQPMVLKEPLVIFVMGVLVVYTAMFYKKGIKLHMILPTICCLGACAIHQRFVSYAVLASFMMLSQIIKKVNRTPWKTGKWYLYVVSCLLLVLSFSISTPLNTDDFNIDKEMITYLEEHPVERPYTIHNDGGELIFNNQKTFIDPRFTDDLMKDAMLASFVKLEDNKTVESYLKEMQFDAVLLNKKDNLALEDYMRLLDNWGIAFESENYILFEPVASQ
jgi:hypothetical protein